MAMKMTSAKSIDEYLKNLPDDIRPVLEKLRQTIKSAAPDAEEVISYGMPAFKQQGMLVYFAAFKNHCSFFPGSAQVVARYEELKAFKTSKGTIQFTVDKPIPAALVKKIVKARVEENEARHSAKLISKASVKKADKSPVKVKKTTRLSDEELVNLYMSKLKGEQKSDIDAVRALIKKSSTKLSERIKWNAPSYFYKQDIVTFGPYKTNKVLLVFHHPAVVKVKSALLQGDYKDRRLVYFKNASDAEQNKKELARIIKEIIKQIDSK